MMYVYVHFASDEVVNKVQYNTKVTSETGIRDNASWMDTANSWCEKQ